MLKLTSMIFTMLGTTLAGIGVLIVLTVPSLSGQDRLAIPVAALIGATIALPLSWAVAKRILALQKTSAA